jgi:two-component system sensor histidine kinase VicK
MRWWLAVAFVLIAILTTVLIATVATRSANHDLATRAASHALDHTLASGFAVQDTLEDGGMKQALALIPRNGDLAVFVFAANGRLVARRGLAVRWQDVPLGAAALSSALADHRFGKTIGGAHATVVGLPVHGTPAAAAVVAYAPEPSGYPAAKTIFRKEIVHASIWALLVAAATGLLAALLISRRLRRIAAAALAIEQGDFERKLDAGFPDEIGALAGTFDRMRLQLGVAFTQLGAERDRFELLLEQLQEGVLAVDRDLHVQFANQKARALFTGVDLTHDASLPESAGGLPLRHVAAGLFAPGAELAEARGQGVDGSMLSLVGVPASGSALAVLVVADITKQERLRQAEHDFVSNASHELRTPVAAILGAVEALQNGAGHEPASRARFVEAIGRQATRLSRLTSSLLTLARAQTNQADIQLEPVRIRQILEEVVALSTPPDGVALRIECDPALSALCSPDVLEQIVSNLVENSLKHTARGDVVLIGRYEGASAVIEVSDSGPGIPAVLGDRVFERFFSADQSRRDGFGLGLAIARDSTEAIGGTLVIDSSGRGTTARVTLRTGQS